MAKVCIFKALIMIAVKIFDYRTVKKTLLDTVIII